MNMQEFVSGCRKCDPRSEPDRAAELLKAAAELGEAIQKQRKKNSVVIPYQEITDKYNEICGGVLPKVMRVTNKRMRAIKTCMTQGFTTADIYSAFRKAVATPFLRGSNERNWRANFDFIMKPDNLQKIIEGVYGSAAESSQEHSYNLNLLVEQAMYNTPKIRKE